MAIRMHVKNYEEMKVAAQTLCARLLEEGIPAERVFDCKLIVYELIGNALQHSSGGATLFAEWNKEHICITVRGENGYQPSKRSACPPCNAERGRGLYLVDAVSVERTVTENGDIFVRIRIRG